MIGNRIGVRDGIQSLEVGVGTGAGGGGGGIPGVTRDATSLWYAPANATEWLSFMTAIGLASAPGSTWNMQEASGTLADAIGAVPLTQSGAGHLYQITVSGWTRKAVVTTDGTVGQKWINSTTAPDVSLLSTVWLGYLAFPAAAPAANRDLIANQATLDCRLNATGKLAGINGANTAGTANPLNAVHLVAVQHDITNSSFVVYTDQEKIVGTFATNTTNPMIVFGGQTAAAATMGYLYGAEFSGAAAEFTSGQMKTLVQGLTGITVPWS